MTTCDLTEALQISHLAKQELSQISMEINNQNNRLMSLQKMNFYLRDLLGTNNNKITELQRSKRYSKMVILFLLVIAILTTILIKIIFF